MLSGLKKARGLALCLPLCLLPMAQARAESGPSSPPDTVSVGALLKDSSSLVAWLKQHHREVAAAAARVAQAEAELGQSRLLPNPSLDFSLSDVTVGATNPPSPHLSFNETAIYSTSLSETVELGKRGPRVASRRLGLDAARQSYLDTLSQKVADARYALGRVVYLEARQKVLEENLQSARRVLDLEKVRLDQGDLSGNDYDRLLLDALSLESDAARNQAELEAARSGCRAELFATCVVDAGDETGDLELLGAAAQEGAAQAATGPDLDTTLARRPDIQATGLERASAQQEAVLARRQAIPDPTLGVGYTADKLTISGDQPSTVFVSVGVPLPVFDHGQHGARNAEARARELEQTAAAALVRSKAEVEALRARQATLEKTLDQLAQRGLPRANAVLETTQKAFDRGQASLTDLLLARKTRAGLLVNVLDLRFEVFNVRNDLRRTLGLDADLARQNS